MRKRGFFAFLALLVAALALVAAGCGGGDEEAATTEAAETAAPAGETTAPEETAAPEETTEAPAGEVEALPTSSCGPLEYEGEGEPQVLVASDLPLQGPSRVQTEQMNNAIRFELNERGWKAGDYNVAFQACDDATAQAAAWDSGKCNQNAQAYAANPSLVALIGTFNSGCALIVIPVLNQAPGGAIGMMSPANTYTCLTEPTPQCQESGEPDKYYPSGERNYLRVAPHDAFQGAAVAEFAQSVGVTSIYVLNDKQAYGLGVASNFRDAAEALGIEIAGFEAWDESAASYEALMQKISESGANGVFLGGILDANGGQLIRDKVAVLGPNAATGDEGVVLLGPDGFTQQATVEPDEGGADEAEGMYLSIAGAPLDQLGPVGQEFAQAFGELYAAELGDTPVDPYAAYGAAAAQVVLDAIATGGADRQAVIDAMFGYRVDDGPIGSFSFNEFGDPTQAEGAIVAISLYRASADTALAEVAEVISPAPETVEAARGGGG